MNLSASAWAVLDQLRGQRAVEDGDIVSKEGRQELIRHNLAVRTTNGPRLSTTNLTREGEALAARYQPNNWGRA